jgi:hypothetical protein
VEIDAFARVLAQPGLLSARHALLDAGEGVLNCLCFPWERRRLAGN